MDTYDVAHFHSYTIERIIIYSGDISIVNMAMVQTVL